MPCGGLYLMQKFNLKSVYMVSYKREKGLCNDCGYLLISPRIWNGKEICYCCYRERLVKNSIHERKKTYEK